MAEAVSAYGRTLVRPDAAWWPLVVITSVTVERGKFHVACPALDIGRGQVRSQLKYGSRSSRRSCTADRRLRNQSAPPPRQGARRPSRARLPPARPGLAAGDQHGHGCRTGGRASRRPSSGQAAPPEPAPPPAL